MHNNDEVLILKWFKYEDLVYIPQSYLSHPHTSPPLNRFSLHIAPNYQILNKKRQKLTVANDV